MATYVADLAYVDPRAKIGDEVSIGPFCVIGPDASIGHGTTLENNVTLMGRVTLGEENHLLPNVVIGAPPQDLSYQGADTEVIIGDRNVIREGVTVNRAGEKEKGITSIGSDNLLMGNCHVAHDCTVGNHIVIANGTLLGGHVSVHDHATLSGGIGVHHFATIGSYSFIAGLSRIRKDVPPYLLVDGQSKRPHGINKIALHRNHFPKDTIEALDHAFSLIYRAKVGLDNTREILRNNGQLFPAVNELLGFIQCQHEGKHGRGRERRNAA